MGFIKGYTPWNKGMPAWNRGLASGKSKKCPVCNNQFYSRPSTYDKTKYCCRKCYYISKLGNVPWNKNIKMSEGFKRKCSLANKGRNYWSKGKSPWNKGLNKENDERVRAYSLKMLGRKLSEEARKNMSDIRKGIPSGRLGKKLSYEQRIKSSLAHSKEKEFTGFKNDLYKRLRISSKYFKWRANIFKRDNYHCQCCGNKGYLEVHHIVKLSYIFRICAITTLEQAINNKAVWDMGNGITYCKECHNKLNNRGGILDAIIT